MLGGVLLVQGWLGNGERGLRDGDANRAQHSTSRPSATAAVWDGHGLGSGDGETILVVGDNRQITRGCLDCSNSGGCAQYIMPPSVLVVGGPSWGAQLFSESEFVFARLWCHPHPFVHRGLCVAEGSFFWWTWLVIVLI